LVILAVPTMISREAVDADAAGAQPMVTAKASATVNPQADRTNRKRLSTIVPASSDPALRAL
jgi:hypothetical protein